MSDSSIEIVNDGRGGSIFYREQDNTINFTWEFAMPPAIALIFGPSARNWDEKLPWAAGRCASIYNAVGAEVVRQQAPGGHYIADIEAGILEIITR